MDGILDVIPTVVEVVGEVFTAITGNTLLTLFLAASLLSGVGIGVFKRLRGAAR